MPISSYEPDVVAPKHLVVLPHIIDCEADIPARGCQVQSSLGHLDFRATSNRKLFTPEELQKGSRSRDKAHGVLLSGAMC